MKQLLFLSVNVLFTSLYAQLSPGVQAIEVKEMAAITNSFTYLELYGDDRAIVPRGYKRVYDSPLFAMDNKYQLYTKGKTVVINFRGSTDKKESWLENFYAAQIPVRGEMSIRGKSHSYEVGKDTAGGVHSGYVLGLVYLKEDLYRELKKLREQGYSDLLITGHSQGGALALLATSLMYHEAPKSSRFLRTKTYTFAQPMVGNKAFISEYNSKFCEKKWSFSFVNREDIVPSMPLSYTEDGYFKAHLLKILSPDEVFEPRQLLKDALANTFSGAINATTHKFSKSVQTQIEKETGELLLPEPKKHVNYTQVGNLIVLPVPEYPLAMKDSTKLEDSLFLAKNERGPDGHFVNKSIYKKNTIAQNHKPYNYYTAVLRTYFPEEYEAIEVKSFGL